MADVDVTSGVKDQKLEVRLATADDYQGVLDINLNVYDGADYLHHQYHEIVSDPDAKCYVCTVDGEVGAFKAMYLLDDGATLMSRAVRVKDKFQGQGLLRLISRKVHEDFRYESGPSRVRTSCTDAVRFLQSERFQRTNRTLATTNFVLFDPIPDIPAPALNPADDKAVAEVSLTQFSHLLDDRQLMNFLFPEGIFTCISWFYDINKSNIRHFKKLSPFILASANLVEFSKRKINNDNEGGAEGKASRLEENENSVQPTHGLMGISSY